MKRIKLRERIQGVVSVELCGAMPEAALNACAARGLRLRNLRRPDALTLRARIRERDLEPLRAAARESGCELKILGRSGGSQNLRLLRRRLWLLIAASVTAAALLASSLFIWEIDVRGNERLSRGQLLRALADCGVERGSFWPGLSADLVRSRMLTELPELAWVTLNVSGSRAVLLAAERRERPEIYAEGEPCDLVAERDGIVTRLSVFSGLPLVEPGQAVTEGELLVSGTVGSLSRPPRKLRAQGSVTAETRYEWTAVCPLQESAKSGRSRTQNRFALQIGKKRVNFYRESGKELDEYEKIIHKYNLGADGLFALPLTLIREERIFTETEMRDGDREQEMRRRLLQTLSASIDGEILASSFSVERRDGLLLVTLHARCSENIAQIRPAGS